MVEDTPQDLVHDLLAEAVFGSHALGRPVIGRAGVISSVTRRSLRRTTARRTARATSSSRRLATSSMITCCRCSSEPPTSALSPLRRARPSASRW